MAEKGVKEEEAWKWDESGLRVDTKPIIRRKKRDNERMKVRRSLRDQGRVDKGPWEKTLDSDHRHSGAPGKVCGNVL
jgi:hypothetical protein